MYGARSGKVVRRVSSLASPMLASKAVVRALPAKLKSLCLVTPHAIEVYHSRSGVAGVICRQIVVRTSAIITRERAPVTSCMVHFSSASSVCFHVLGPFLEVVTRVINKRWDDAYQ